MGLAVTWSSAYPSERGQAIRSKIFQRQHRYSATLSKIVHYSCLREVVQLRGSHLPEHTLVLPSNPIEHALIFIGWKHVLL